METWAGKHRLGTKYVTVFKYLWPEKVLNSCIGILETFIRFDNITMPSYYLLKALETFIASFTRRIPSPRLVVESLLRDSPRTSRVSDFVTLSSSISRSWGKLGKENTTSCKNTFKVSFIPKR